MHHYICTPLKLNYKLFCLQEQTESKTEALGQADAQQQHSTPGQTALVNVPRDETVQVTPKLLQCCCKQLFPVLLNRILRWNGFLYRI